MKDWLWKYFYEIFMQNRRLKNEVANLRKEVSTSLENYTKAKDKCFSLELEVGRQGIIIEDLIRELQKK